MLIGDTTGSGDAQDVRRGPATAGVFIARDRFMILDKTKQLCVKNMTNETLKRSPCPLPTTDNLFFAGTSGRVLLKSEDRVVLFDHQARKVLGEIHVPRVKYVIWNHDYSFVALVSKHQIVLANKQLEQLCSISEGM